MSRALRIEYPGAWYHVMNRGAANQQIFYDSDHYKIFLHLLNELHDRFQIRIHAYCLMPNHYHILMQTPLANLSRAMRHLDSLYTRRYNVSQKRDGPLLRGRFKSILVDGESYLLQLSRYIHLNPVVANIVIRAEDYLWSSYPAYLNSELRPSWLFVDETLSRFDSENNVLRYRLFIAQGIDQQTDAFYKKLKLLPILGCEAFAKTIHEKYLKDRKISPEISQQKFLKNIPTIANIMQVVAGYYRIDELNLKMIKYKDGNRPRQIAIYLASKLSGHKYQIIADEFTKISVAGVAKIYQRIVKQMAIDVKLEEEIALLEKRLMSFVKI